MDNISWQNIRNAITHCLAKSNSNEYETLLSKLEKARLLKDVNVITQYESQIKELSKSFKFDIWMNKFINEKVKFISVVTHSGKGVHTAIKHCNVNYIVQTKPESQRYVSSATPQKLSFDCTNDAAKSTSVFKFFNQIIKDNITVFDLIIKDSSELLSALSDDIEIAKSYLVTLKKAIFNDFSHPKASELSKQIFWPNSTASYLSQQENNYRLLIPLYPNSLCYIVYQKVQTRNSQENKKARIQRSKREIEHNSYFSFNDLAILKLGGTKPLNVGQINQLQKGNNFLLPSMPPKFEKTKFPSIGTQKETIFDHSLQYFCRFGFRLLFEMVKVSNKVPNNVIDESENRKDAFAVILSLLLKFARHIQTTLPAGWSRESSLNFNQKLWLDPNRVDLEDETEFKQQYELGNWQEEIEKQFAFWIQKALEEKHTKIKQQFSNSEFREWRREFSIVVKASQRKQEGIF